MQKAIPSLYPSWLFAWAIEKCWRTRNTAPDNLMGNRLPRTAAQQGISCHEMARTAWGRTLVHSLLCCESPDRKPMQKSHPDSPKPCRYTAGQPYASFGIFSQDFKDCINQQKLLTATPKIEGI
jgi:hypothetical protein